MTIATDTDDLLGVWGETVTIVRNTPTFGSTGAAVDSWATVATVSADIQPFRVKGGDITSAIGEQRESDVVVFFPSGTALLQGDRLRKSGWVAGDDEYVLDVVQTEEGHVECYGVKVSGHG